MHGYDDTGSWSTTGVHFVPRSSVEPNPTHREHGTGDRCLKLQVGAVWRVCVCLQNQFWLPAFASRPRRGLKPRGLVSRSSWYQSCIEEGYLRTGAPEPGTKKNKWGSANPANPSLPYMSHESPDLFFFGTPLPFLAPHRRKNERGTFTVTGNMNVMIPMAGRGSR